ncbi:Leucine Rich Repeat family protein [Histomonas meleagridis]|uniref:Leucine Rich Repeat family protein n=1 Tax=Histomonas meleagridis TaxID=135588 RepID=UPI00355ACA25|nr:Leucine Rich Repeat family protein [Histomonas meleagridis]KAH0799653.1 Leucine Rich Repeat family protein [Histomonas meleagridis]
MPQLNIPFPNSDVQIPPFKRAISRLRARLFAERPTVPEDLIKTYQEFLKSGNTCLDFSQIAVHHYYAPLLDSLLVVPHVTSVEVPTTETSHWKEIGSFLAKTLNVTSFKTSERIDSHFSEFLEELSQSKNKVLKSVTFSCPKITESDMSTIVGIVQQCEIEDLTIVHCLNRNTIDVLCKHLTKAPSLKRLTIDHAELIDPIKVICTLPKLDYFGCPHSDCELCSIFQNLSTVTDISLSTLNFSGNSFKDSFKKPINLPPNICKLILDDVDFNGTAFQNLFSKMIFKSPEPISLSVKRFKIDKTQWLNFQKTIAQYVEIGNAQLNIQELFWDGNNLSPEFFGFLEKCKPLTVLSISGCIDGSETAIIQNLTEFISSTLTVTDLRISGTENKSISTEALITILNSFSNDNRMIRKLDISHNQMNSNVFDTLANVLMSNRAIEYIDFTNSKITDPNIFKKFFTSLLQRGTPLKFPFPTSDIYEMEKNNTIDKTTVNELKTLAEKIEKGNPSIQVPKESISMPTTPITASYHAMDNDDIEDSDTSDSEDWTYFPAQVPAIDNYEIESVLAEQFSLQKIVERIRSH